MKKLIIKLSIIFLLSFVIIINYKLWLPLPANLLLIKDNLQKADCIVPLLGDPCFRFKKAVELYNKGYSKNIVISYVPEQEHEYYSFYNYIYGMKVLSSKEYNLSVFKYFGMDPQGIYFTNLPSTSTYEEAVAIKEIMLKEGFKSMILVTSAYHARRAMIIFKWVFRNTGIKIYNCTAKNELFNPHCWWVKERDVKEVVLEYSSMIHNFIYHFMLKKGRTSFDTY